MRAIIALAWSGVCLYTYFSGSENPRDHSLRSRQLLVENADTDTTSVDAVDLTLDVDSSNDIISSSLADEESIEPQRYQLRDLSEYTKNGLSWFNDNEHYSDLSQCMDFKCNKDINVCDNTESTSYNDPDGPCCTHILRDMLRTFDDSMATLGLDYFIGFGTLLGLTRSGKVIPWTADNDVIIDTKTLQAMTDLWSTESNGLAFVSHKMGPKKRGVPRMCITSQFAGGKLQRFMVPTPKDVDFPDRGFPYMDLYFGRDTGHGTYGNEYISMGKPCRHFQSDIFPIKRQWAYGGQFALNFPAKPEQLLKRYYGLDWKVPLTDHSEHGNPRKICAVNYGLEEVNVTS